MNWEDGTKSKERKGKAFWYFTAERKLPKILGFLRYGMRRTGIIRTVRLRKSAANGNFSRNTI